jgi:hypothetical protein
VNGGPGFDTSDRETEAECEADATTGFVIWEALTKHSGVRWGGM